MNNITKRALSGTVYVGAILGALMGGPLPFFLLFTLLTALSLYEFFGLTPGDQATLSRTTGIAGGVIIFAGLFLTAGDYIASSSLLWLLLLPMIIWIIELFRKKEHTAPNMAYALTGLIYPALLLSTLNLLYFRIPLGEPYNTGLVTSLFVLIWTHDTFAYIIGKQLGKHKLLERISPGKSWEGFTGGLVFTILASWIISRLQVSLPPIDWIMLGVIVTITGTLGDLCESALKRNAGVKHSGKLIPGHGGILDRLDAAIFIFPAAYLYLNFIALSS
jgi:phosphatidate cytidylyltransferase